MDVQENFSISVANITFQKMVKFSLFLFKHNTIDMHG